jgi:hypothetical protein
MPHFLSRALLLPLHLAALAVPCVMHAQTPAFVQDFNLSDNIDTYRGSSPGLFDLLTGTDGAEVSVVEGRLVLTKSSNGRGIAYVTRLTPLPLSPDRAFFFEVDVLVHPLWQGSGSGALIFTFGENFRRNGNTGGSSRRAQIQIALGKKGDCSLFEVEQRVSSRPFVPSAKPFRLRWMINPGTTPVDYESAANGRYTLEPGTMDAWVDRERLLQGVPVQGPALSHSQFAISLGASAVTNSGFTLDNTLVQQLAP